MNYFYFPKITLLCYFFYLLYSFQSKNKSQFETFLNKLYYHLDKFLRQDDPDFDDVNRDNKKTFNIFFNNLHYHIDKFLRRDDPDFDDVNTEEENANEKKNDSTTKKLPIRFEDKYLEEHRSLQNIELTADQLDNLKNNILIENTPIGNVLMLYDNKKETFVFYSDLTIPYRYLEVVGRKYAITYNCKKLYIDMNEELKISEEKKQQTSDNIANKNSDTDATSNANDDNNANTNKKIETKKDVFAKFKTYNNNVTKDVAAAPSKNAVPSIKKENENVLLKENANRYRYEGKIVNFNFLQPISKKTTDKRLAMTWADYKNNSA